MKRANDAANVSEHRRSGRTGSQAHVRLDDQLSLVLYSAASVMMRSHLKPLRDIGLTFPQYLVMLALWEKDYVSLSALSNQLCVNCSSLTTVLARLERLGYLIRAKSLQDERKLSITLTAAGRLLCDKALRISQEMATASEAPSSPNAALAQSLKGLRERMQERTNAHRVRHLTSRP